MTRKRHTKVDRQIQGVLGEVNRMSGVEEKTHKR